MGLISFLVILVPFLCLLNISTYCAALECIRDDCIRTRSRMFPTWLEYKENTRSFNPYDDNYEGNMISFGFFGFNRISETTFATNHSENIIALNVSRNDITYIAEKSFTSLLCLDTLDLSHNRLNYLLNDTFVGLSKLRILNLSYNILEFVIEPDFKSLENLEILDLSNNEIEFVGRYAFSDLVNLKSLLLNENRIRKILHSDVFENLFSLLHLNLESNWLSIVAGYMFGDLHSLERLNLAQNGLAIFLLDGVGNKWLPHLIYMNLSGNNLMELNVRKFKDLYGNDELLLDLNDNKFYCPTIDVILTSLRVKSVNLAPGRTFGTENQRDNYSCVPTNTMQNVSYDEDELFTIKKYQLMDKTSTTTEPPTTTLSTLEALMPLYLQEMTYHHNVEIVLMVVACTLLLSGILITVDYVLNFDYLRKLCACTRSQESPEESPNHPPIEHIPLQGP